MRKVLARATVAKLTARQWRVLAAVVAYTGTYSKVEDDVYLRVLAAFVFGVQPNEARPWQLDKVGRELGVLANRGLVLLASPPRRGRPPGARGPRYRLGLNPSGAGRITGEEIRPAPSRNPSGVGKTIRPGPGDLPRSSTEKKTEKKTHAADSEFESFWAHWPRGRKVGKPNALRAFSRARRAAELDEILRGEIRWVAHWRDTDTEARWIPHPATWLNQQRWNDDPPPPPRDRALANRASNATFANEWTAARSTRPSGQLSTRSSTP
jgi:hypothetical protein